MTSRKGRPMSENPKNYMLRVRMDQETLKHLDICCESEHLTRSEIVRRGIQEQYERLKK